ncbi:putative disease resistance protein RGA4 [Senna tora]|uniref:Putative disease resistance protein RGA4 n=1 Tax=Senna tora TaxID=362788 RepID=A0A834TLM2_9FABA|nr:putative disease resistance protein RGA4 [Senna tora]
MDAIAAKIINELTSPIAEEVGVIWNFKDDLENTKNVVSSIKAVLGDAEGKATNLQVTDWLQKVKDVFLDAEDLLDDYFSALALRRQAQRRPSKLAKEVRIFFSESNLVLHRLKMGHQLKRILKRMEDIAKVKNELKFIESSPLEAPYREREQTHSFVAQHEIIGREEEKKRKTTLAQLVYNDKVVQEYFEPRTWVCVSENFNIKQIVQKILGQPNNREMEQLQQDLRNKVEGKRFLLVLDDIWNEDRELWFRLKNLLMGGKRGSMIIVTTRSEKVSRIIDSNLCISLQGLDEEKSWELFSWAAFTTQKQEEEEEEPNTELIHIGKDIVKKCAGVPLAIRTVGSLLYSRNLGERDWVYFRDTKLSKIHEEEGEEENNKIFAILRLSYDHLPSHLRNCFAYCSLFPKDYEIERDTLIQLWIAQGFIQTPPDQTRTLEDVGHEYFMSLLSRSFFQSSKLDDYGGIRTFKMHDLIHDLAQVVCGSEYVIINEEEEEEEDINGDRIRHLSFELKHSLNWKVPTCIGNLEKLRTIFSPKDNNGGGYDDLRLYEYIGDPTTTSFPKRLRVLDLFGLQIREIPKSVGKLKHLRYLDLSYNISIEKLPKSITKLRNLQTLKLNYCGMLKELPRDMNNMASLRHLELDGCFELDSMFPSLGQLTCLQTLTQFVLSDRRKMSDSARIGILGVLRNLRGKLLIKGLKHERANPVEVETAKLHKKPYLRELELVWSDKGEQTKSFSTGRGQLHGSGGDTNTFCLGTDDEMEHIGEKDEMILEALQPHHTIKRLHISDFCGKRLSEWMGNLASLMKLEINSCPCLTSLPKSIGNLASLKKLKIMLCYDLTILPDSIGNLLSLQELNIELCNGLVSLPESIGKLKSLWELQIISCHGLTSLPKGFCDLTCLKTLKIFDCPRLCYKRVRLKKKEPSKVTYWRRERLYNQAMSEFHSSVASFRRGRHCFYYDRAIILTSNIDENLGRRFWRCKNFQGVDDCDFFDWIDQLVVDGKDIAIERLGAKILVTTNGIVRRLQRVNRALLVSTLILLTATATLLFLIIKCCMRNRAIYVTPW